MSMRINTNLDALTAQRNLATTGLAYSKSVAKLSSGMRINSAADDAAGLTISEKLRAQTDWPRPGFEQCPGRHFPHPDW